MSIKISIPKPCSEDWNEMTPTEKGAFCASCEKEVIDFTAHSQRELARKIASQSRRPHRKKTAGDNRPDSRGLLKQGAENSSGICGRFRPDQLDTALPGLTRSKWRDRVVAAGFTALLLGSCSPEEEVLPDSNRLRSETQLEEGQRGEIIEVEEQSQDIPMTGRVLFVEVGCPVPPPPPLPAGEIEIIEVSEVGEIEIEEVEDGFLFGDVIIVED